MSPPMKESDLIKLVADLEARGVTRAKIGGFDIDGLLRGKYVSLEKLTSALTGGFGFCDVIFGWDSQDDCYDATELTGWHTGYPDMLARVDLETMRLVPWESGTAAFMCDLWREAETPFPDCPRNLLKSDV